MKMKAVFVMMILLLISVTASAETRIRMASTTSTQNSGLFDYLLPLFEKKTGIKIDVVAVGTGASIEIGRRGDADVVFVHAKEQELKAVEEGFFVNRHDVMYNDFIIIGPKHDPAAVRGMQDVVAAMKKISASGAKFISRGDASGTHQMEKDYWRAAGVDAKGAWYVSAGQGMGQVLTMAAELDGYALTDRATYAAYKDKTGLAMLVEGDPKMFNPYGVIAVNPQRHPRINARGATAFVNWITSGEGQRIIADFKINGEPMFFPAAR